MSSPTAVSRAQNQGGAEPAATAARHNALGMFIVLIAQLMLVLDSTVVNVALPHIHTDLGFSTAGLSWVLNGYTLAFGGLLLLGGRLGDVFGRRSTFWWGLAVFTVFSFVGGLAQSPEMLIASRALQGVGAAVASPSVLALLMTSAPDEHARHRALAAFSAVSSGGGGLGLILGGVLTQAISWRWTLFINVPIGIAVLVLVRRFVTETPRQKVKFDFVGAIAATAGAVAIVWAFVEAPSDGWSSAEVIGGFVVGALLLAVLAFTETRVQHPMLRPELLRGRRRIGGLIAMAAFYGAMLGLFFLMVQFLEEQLGFSPLLTGIAFLPMPGSVFALSRITPRLVARFGRTPFLIIGPAGVSIALLLLTQLHADSHYFWAAFPSIWLMGLSGGVFFMPLTATVLDGVAHEHAGSASGLLQTMQQLGGAIGLAVIASVFAGRVHAGFASGADAGFVAALCLALVGLVAAITVASARKSAA